MSSSGRGGGAGAGRLGAGASATARERADWQARLTAFETERVDWGRRRKAFEEHRTPPSSARPARGVKTTASAVSGCSSVWAWSASGTAPRGSSSTGWSRDGRPEREKPGSRDVHFRIWGKQGWPNHPGLLGPRSRPIQILIPPTKGLLRILVG